MYAIVSRGGARTVQFVTPLERRPPRQPEPWLVPVPGAEAAKLLLRGQGWENMVVASPLNLSGQERLRELPDGLQCGIINLANCVNLERLPERLVASLLDVSGCVNLREVPASARVTGGIEVAGAGLTGVPSALRSRLRWNGVAVDARTAFQPETITGQEILNTRNAEVRRVRLERVGYERFIAEVGGLILDRDRDAGGERRLVRVPLTNDEDIVVVCVTCPSTGRAYVLRVPPTTRSCRQAAAWIAGFDNPNDYQPVVEA